RTPLSTILSSASLVDSYKETGDVEKIEKHVKRIKSSVSHLTGILNDFLSLGKLEEGKIELITEGIHLKSFIQEICDEMVSNLKEGQKINVKFTCDQEEIESDPKLLRNILFNLISNASKYSDVGKPIHLNCICEKTALILEIRDE